MRGVSKLLRSRLLFRKNQNSSATPAIKPIDPNTPPTTGPGVSRGVVAIPPSVADFDELGAAEVIVGGGIDIERDENPLSLLRSVVAVAEERTSV